MTTEEKAKAYDEALEKARQFSEHPDLEDSGGIVEYIFPELKESEDEMIRKTLITYMKSVIDINGIKGETIIAWLEKQAEKPVNTTMQEKAEIDNAFTRMMLKPQVDGFDAELNALLKKYEHLPKEDVAECLSFYLGVVQGDKPQVICPYCKNASCTYVDGHWLCLDCHREFNIKKWSEEDEENFRDIISAIHSVAYQTTEDEVSRIDWLKSLKKRMEE